MTDIGAMIATGISTGVVTIPAAAYLARLFLENRMKRDVDTYLAERAAERDYTWEARKRLYEAIGPLRFQLVLACRDLSNRIEDHGKREQYDTAVSGYYGQSTLYRILRPVALAALIERQMYYADFSVDSQATELLRFNRRIRTCLCREMLVRGYPKLNWDEQIQHVFSEVLATAASSLILDDGSSKSRVLRFDEFELRLKKQTFRDMLDPFPSLLENFSSESKPVLWLRLVALAHVSREFVRKFGQALGVDESPLQLRELLLLTKDSDVVDRVDTYIARCHEILQTR